MSYNEANHVYGCGYPNPTGQPCVYPGDIAVDALPGSLLSEDVRVLDHNDRAFPDLDWIIALDGDVTYRGTAIGNTQIAGHPTVEMTSADQGDGHPPSVLIGDKGQAMLEAFEPANPLRMWTSSAVGDGNWATVQVELPGALALRRVDVYAGFDGGENTLTGLRLRQGATVLDERLFTGSVTDAHIELASTAVGSTFEIDVRAGADDAVTLRAIRLFADMNGRTVEVFPSIEPTVVTASAGTYAGDVDAIVGSTQRVPGFFEAFDPDNSWHSDAIHPGDRVELDVEFAEPVVLGALGVHTGHSGVFHVAQHVRLLRECACTAAMDGARDGCGAHSARSCSGGAPQVFETVTFANLTADATVSFPAREARTWRISLRTPTVLEQPISPGRVVVRGLRFFDPAGNEIAPARFVNEGL